MPDRQGGRPVRVLVVEDERIVARDLAGQLQEMGYVPVALLGSAEEALDQVAALCPDLVLMDIALAGPMDGVAAAQVMRERHGLPVVFLTAYAADDIIERAKLTEPFGYILKPFSDRELRTVLAMALYKHRAEQRLIDSNSQLQALSRRVLQAQEQERRRLAVELHDELGQSLTAIKINLQLAQRLANPGAQDWLCDSIAIVETALQQVRGLATALRPSVLDDLGLVEALQWLLEQAAARSGWQVELRLPTTPQRLAPDIETACFRIVQEALTNVARHAQARRVALSLQREGDDLVLEVTDDGLGLMPEQARLAAQGGQSLGLLGMQERAMLIGGSLTVTAGQPRGCMVRLVCPWRTQDRVAA